MRCVAGLRLVVSITGEGLELLVDGVRKGRVAFDTEDARIVMTQAAIGAENVARWEAEAARTVAPRGK